jgi:hypothetical protein
MRDRCSSIHRKRVNRASAERHLTNSSVQSRAWGGCRAQRIREASRRGHRRDRRDDRSGRVCWIAFAGSDDSDAEVAQLEQQLTTTRQESKYWNQLTSLLEPVELKSMSDHRAFMLPSGVLVALHFDDMDLDKARNLNWVAVGFPGRFCRSDQRRVERRYGPGMTHFHDLENDAHGGSPGVKGVWFVHVAVRDFEAPWGQVRRGIDRRFMPTPAPACA